MRSNAAPSRDSATAAAVTAKTIWAIGTRCTGSGYAEDDQRESQGDGAAGERAQSALRLGGERLAGDGEGRSVGELDAPRRTSRTGVESRRCAWLRSEANAAARTASTRIVSAAAT